MEQWSQRRNSRLSQHADDSDVSEASTSGSSPRVFITNPYKKPSLARLIRLNAPEWSFAILGSVGAMMAGWKTPLAALGMSDILVSFYSFDPLYIEHQVRKICLLFTAAIPITIIAFVMQNYFFEVMGERLTIRVREKMFACKAPFSLFLFIDKLIRCYSVLSMLRKRSQEYLLVCGKVLYMSLVNHGLGCGSHLKFSHAITSG